MIRSLDKLSTFKVHSTDLREMGKIKDLYFDDEAWTLRYFVVETGGWLNSQKVLISPYAVREVNWEHAEIYLRLNQEQIKSSPSPETDKPVSRLFEEKYSTYYGYPYYWGSSAYAWGGGVYPGAWMPPVSPVEKMDELRREEERRAQIKPDESHLRSLGEVKGYHMQAIDVEFGHVQDLLIEDESWAIRYLVIDTVNWWPSRSVLISPKWIEKISWHERLFYTNYSKETILKAPSYEAHRDLGRPFEELLFKHYGAVPYWAQKEGAKGAKSTIVLEPSGEKKTA